MKKIEHMLGYQSTADRLDNCQHFLNEDDT